MSDIKEDTLIPVPLWVLKNKVETDFEEWMFLNAMDEEDQKDEETAEEFPVYDSTQQVLKILEQHDVFFDTNTGLWKE